MLKPEKLSRMRLTLSGRGLPASLNLWNLEAGDDMKDSEEEGISSLTRDWLEVPECTGMEERTVGKGFLPPFICESVGGDMY